MTERRAYAVHEAGHAVVAQALGRTVCAVWIAVECARGGAEIHTEGIALADGAAICWAGQEATDLLNVESPSRLAKGDWERFIGLTSRMDAKEQERLRQDARARARELLRENIKLLKALADALERDGAIDHVTFRRIVDNCAHP